MTIVGTRPEIIKLSRVIYELDRHTDHVLVHTGQNYNYELNEIFFKQLEIRKPDHFLNAAVDSVAETIGNVGGTNIKPPFIGFLIYLNRNCQSAGSTIQAPRTNLKYSVRPESDLPKYCIHSGRE